VLIAISPPLHNTAAVVNGPSAGAPATAPVARPLTDERGNTTGSGSVAPANPGR
jgi:hypothetical protein